jgi:hypothetical protein
VRAIVTGGRFPRLSFTQRSSAGAFARERRHPPLQQCAALRNRAPRRARGAPAGLRRGGGAAALRVRGTAVRGPLTTRSRPSRTLPPSQASRTRTSSSPRRCAARARARRRSRRCP